MYLREQLKGELDAHIAMCEPCLHFLGTYDKTRILCRQVTLDEIPPEFRERLRSFVLEKARERREGIEKYLQKDVITSYSIHYTKLYEGRPPPGESSRTPRPTG